MGLIWWLITGLVVGAVARIFVHSPRQLGCIGTSVLGILGSLVGGTLFNLITGNGIQPRFVGFIGSVFGAMVLLVLARLFVGGRRARAFEDRLDRRR